MGCQGYFRRLRSSRIGNDHGFMGDQVAGANSGTQAWRLNKRSKRDQGLKQLLAGVMSSCFKRLSVMCFVVSLRQQKTSQKAPNPETLKS